MELYDLSNDPHEKYNIASDNPQVTLIILSFIRFVFYRNVVDYLKDYAFHEYNFIVPPKTGLVALHTVRKNKNKNQRWTLDL